MIYGIAEPILRGKMVAPKQRKRYNKQIPLPSNVKKDVMLYIDILYVNGNPFLHAKSKDINYISIERLKDRELSTLIEKVEKVFKMYTSRGFYITDVYADNEFNHDAYATLFLPGRLHICATGEHVPTIERSVRTVKERARLYVKASRITAYQGLCYKGS